MSGELRKCVFLLFNGQLLEKISIRGEDVSHVRLKNPTGKCLAAV